MSGDNTSATLGILGGGQLAQMLALAAIPLGVKVVVLEPDPQTPARVCARHIQAPYTDHAGLDALAACDAVTLEFENVPVAALDYLHGKVAVRPGAELLHLSKHRAREKAALQAAGAATAPYTAIDSAADLPAAQKRLAQWGGGILKTSELGYDGKGQVRLGAQDSVQAAWEELGQAPCVLEGLVAFRREVSLGVARSLTAQGEVLAYGGLVENLHQHGILRRSLYLPHPDHTQARELAGKVARAWKLEGLMTLEFFELPSGELLVNEVAPRVHNSGHLTQDGGGVSQFETQVRAALSWPIHDFAPLLPCAMVNILGWKDGAAMPNLDRLRALEGVHVHLYGKENRPGRKLGHVNVVAASEQELRLKLAEVEALIP